ncbi:efflux RND transporter periplasmic adaptor subunit [Massilia sp. NP310]|jgi:membrane fusion protein, heavy metal efflux system|uniref:efflux RND transporter periplasmic adaptor subunit n=1 Tax=Massilia sp. NP310 TaxID=2861282 RepID=UPI001C6393DD|nr:efflux RND transporter periplasmic adaptor subunit [Massilia sp. NP310]QYG02789.1 efflux RND transporter periplasmic adaptor subunit [Massilia sp. NP310]
MNEQSRRPTWPVAALLLAIAGALGFGAANLLQPKTPPQTIAASASVPAAGGNATEPADEVTIPAEYLSIAGIAVEPVASGGLEAEILTAGTVTAAPNSEAILVARAPGNVTRIERQLGDAVKAGDVVARVESQEAAAMSTERNVARARAELARKTFARESTLFEQGITPRQEMEAAQAALAVANAEFKRAADVARSAKVSSDGASVAVVSPISGKVTAQTVTLGSYVQPQTELFRIASAAQPLIEVSVPAADIGRIAVGDKATLVRTSGTPVEATVRSVTPTVSGSSRAATVLLSPAQGAQLIVGEGVQARLHIKDGGADMTVPEDAVQNIEGRDVLFVRTKDGFRPTPVLVGNRSRGMAQIVSGVKPGDQVATRNAFLVKADMIKAEKDE